MIDFNIIISDEQWKKATNKEKQALATIRQRNKGWSNFELYRNENNDYIFSVTRESQSFDGYIKVFFVSDLGRFCFRLAPELTEVRDIKTNEIIQDITNHMSFTACQLLFYYQVCEILDGLLPGYYAEERKL